MKVTLTVKPPSMQSKPCVASSLAATALHVDTTLQGRKEMFYLTTHSTHFFILRLYGIGHMVKDHSDSERKPAAATWATLSD